LSPRLPFESIQSSTACSSSTASVSIPLS
jgi:hypothetical protein